MRTVRLVIGFQGTHYEGWQSQGRHKTIQEVFEKTLRQILKEKTGIISSSRTDSGVHARGLVAHLKTKSPLSDRKLKAALNFYLPGDILVGSVKTVRSDFHARYSAKSKVYRYDIWNSLTRPLFEAPYVLWYPHRLHLGLIRQGAGRLIGKHDFNAFRDGKDPKKSTVRNIKRLSVSKKGPMISILVEADGFLKHMVRIIVGTLIEVGRRKIPPQRVTSILASKDRRQAGPTAKSHGLTLLKVRY